MGDYDIYYKRLNRYGYDYQSRIQSERERNFDLYLLKSVYRVEFRYNGEVYEGTLERNTEDVTQTTSYLLTRTRDTIPGGTILLIPGFKGEGLIPWLVWYQLEREAKGYNKYMMLFSVIIILKLKKMGFRLLIGLLKLIWFLHQELYIALLINVIK